MIFLTEDDFNAAIKDAELKQIVSNNIILLDAAVLAAIQEIQSYLKARFDVAAIFAAVGDARNAQIVMYNIDIALYHIHARVAPRQLPEARLARYEQAIAWLKMVASGAIIPDLPLLPVSNNGGGAWGSRTPFNYE